MKRIEIKAWTLEFVKVNDEIDWADISFRNHLGFTKPITVIISEGHEPEYCVWNGHYNWISGCGNEFSFDPDMDDVAGDWKFCPYCGKTIKIEE